MSQTNKVIILQETMQKLREEEQELKEILKERRMTRNLATKRISCQKCSTTSQACDLCSKHEHMFATIEDLIAKCNKQLLDFKMEYMYSRLQKYAKELN